MNWDCLGCRKLRAKNAQLRAERDLIDVNARSGRKAAAIVTAERDELLVALKDAVSHMDHYIDYDRRRVRVAVVAGYMDIIVRAGVKL